VPALNNLVATPVTVAVGTTVVASGSTNTKGSWTELFAAATVTYDVYGVTLLILNDSASATVTRNLYDVGIGGSGSEIVKIPDILNTGPTSLNNAMSAQQFFLPIFIPKGTRIAMRKQSNVASKTSSCAMWLHGGGGIPPWTVFSRCDSYATDTATSGGLVHTPGSSGTYSTWTNIGNTLARDYGAVMPMIGMGSDTTMTTLTAYLQVGINSVSMGQYLHGINNVEHLGNVFPSLPIFHHWVTGSQLMIRSTTSGTTDDNYEYGFLAYY
jgi:hypothetical protein